LKGTRLIHLLHLTAFNLPTLSEFSVKCVNYVACVEKWCIHYKLLIVKDIVMWMFPISVHFPNIYLAKEQKPYETLFF